MKTSLYFSAVIVFLLVYTSDGIRVRRLIKPKIRNNNKFFVRLTLKNNIFPTSILFAYGAGYRINWDTAPMFKERSSTTRQQFHILIQYIMQRYGLDGEACLRRAACELTKIIHTDTLDKIIQILFRDDVEERKCYKGNSSLEYNCSFSLVGLTSYILEKVFFTT